ncbi:MAG: SpoIIE family protein phosphatase [Actinobacteria bacterium]|nr:SpoIIE family protein phosphatase [Actinomycetota bacterium]
MLYWYSGLALLGVAFAISLVSGAPSGNPVSWLQRGGQWLAGIYLLAGLLSLTAGRERAPFALERALEESEDRYRKLIDTNPDAILVVADGKVAFANPASAALLGAGSPLELRGTEWLSFVHTDSRRSMDEGGASTLGGSLLPQQDVVLVGLDGQVRDAEVTASRIELEGRLAMQVLLRDVSLRKQTERNRERLVVDQQQLNQELSAANRELQAQTEELAGQEEKLRMSYERQSETAREQQVLFDRLQRVFLDKLPDLPEVEFAYAHVSATTGAQVGGDFYDLFYLDDDSLGLMIGDVSGQGIEASRIALMAKDSIRAFALEEPKSGNVVERVNRLLTKRGLPGFITAFFGILDLRTGHLASASAGHPPPFILLSGEVSQLEVAPGLPLGVFPDAVYHERHTVLPNQALLLLYTDGLTEARRDGRMYGEGRLRLMLSRTTLLPLSQVPHLLVEDALTFADGRVTDDAAVLLLRYKACR